MNPWEPAARVFPNAYGERMKARFGAKHEDSKRERRFPAFAGNGCGRMRRRDGSQWRAPRQIR